MPQPALEKMSVARYEEWACGVNELLTAGSTGKVRATRSGSMSSSWYVVDVDVVDDVDDVRDRDRRADLDR